MPRTYDSDLQTKLETGSTQLCHLVTITRTDGQVFRYTDLDRDLIVGADTFESSNSFAVTAITSSTNNGIQSTNCKIFFAAGGFTELDIGRGLYDSADVEFSVIDYVHPEWGRIILMKGKMSAIDGNDRGTGQFELNGLLSIGDAKIGELYSPECRANLGDARCTIDTSLFNKTGYVNFVDVPANFKNSVFWVNIADATSRFFDGGVITFTSGANNGISMEVQAQFPAHALEFGPNNHDIFTALPFPYDIAPADTFTIVAGCDKRPITCLTRFDNIVNFRGEPFVPGSDYINDLKHI